MSYTHEPSFYFGELCDAHERTPHLSQMAGEDITPEEFEAIQQGAVVGRYCEGWYGYYLKNEGKLAFPGFPEGSLILVDTTNGMVFSTAMPETAEDARFIDRDLSVGAGYEDPDNYEYIEVGREYYVDICD